jgi:hypothetical protein
MILNIWQSLGERSATPSIMVRSFLCFYPLPHSFSTNRCGLVRHCRISLWTWNDSVASIFKEFIPLPIPHSQLHVKSNFGQNFPSRDRRSNHCWSNRRRFSSSADICNSERHHGIGSCGFIR